MGWDAGKLAEIGVHRERGKGDPTNLLPNPGTGWGEDTLWGGGVNGPCPSPQIDHVAQFSRLPVASLLFILSGTRAGDL